MAARIGDDGLHAQYLGSDFKRQLSALKEHCDKMSVNNFPVHRHAGNGATCLNKFSDIVAPKMLKSVNDVVHALSNETLPNCEFPGASEKMRLHANILLKSTAEGYLLQEYSYMDLEKGSIRKKISPIEGGVAA